MATIRIGAAAPDSFSGFLFNDIGSTSRGSTRMILTNDDATATSYRLIIEGTGFEYSGSQVVGGTISTIRAFDSAGHVLVTYSNLSLSLERFITTLDVAGTYDASGLLVSRSDRLIGSSGADALEGGSGNDYISAGKGDDFVADYAGRDTLDGGAGFDEISFSNDIYDSWHPMRGVSLDALTGVAIDPWGYTNRISNFESYSGSYQDDVIKGSNITTYTEVYRGLLGSDTIDGRGGLDRVEYDRDAYYGGSLGVNVNLTRGRAWDGYGNLDHLYNIEQVGGTAKNDTITGSAAANQLYGQAGNDILKGMAGNDVLTGGKGYDTLTGGAGKDTFAFNYSSEGRDRITDFVSADDTISVSSGGFGGVLATGTLDKSLLVRGADPIATLDTGQFLYNTKTGLLSWDVDGTGSKAAVSIAILTGAPSVVYGDIAIF